MRLDDSLSGLGGDALKQIAHHLHGEHFTRGAVICGGDGDLAGPSIHTTTRVRSTQGLSEREKNVLLFIGG